MLETCSPNLHGKCMLENHNDSWDKDVCVYCKMCSGGRSRYAALHWHCKGCDIYHCFDNPKYKKCRRCTVCKVACECLRCADCTELNESCECKHFEYTLRHAPVFHNSKTFIQNDSKRHLGVEIEVCGLKRIAEQTLNKVVDKYHADIKKDGSLPIRGLEVCSAPANGDLFLIQVNEICNALKKHEAWIDGSAGLHVHVDFRKQTFADLRKLALFYSLIEPAIFKLVHKSRHNSVYATACADTYQTEYMSPSAKRDPRFAYMTLINRSYPSDSHKGPRHRALNLQAYLDHKTVECRLHEGTLDSNTINRWGMIWANVIDYAGTLSIQTVEDLVNAKSVDPDLLLKACATSSIIKSYLDSVLVTPSIRAAG